MTSADPSTALRTGFCPIPSGVTPVGRSRVRVCDTVLSGTHWFVSRYRAQPFPSIAGTWSAGSPSRHFHQTDCGSSLDRYVGQISPDKNVSFRDTTAAFTLFPRTPGFVHVVQTHPETGPCMLFLFPGSSPGQAWLIALHSGFLQTVPRGSALAFG